MVDNPEKIFEKAERQYSQGRYAQGLRLLDGIEKDSVEESKILILKGKMLLAQGKEEDASCILKKVSDVMPVDIKKRIKAARDISYYGEHSIAFDILDNEDLPYNNPDILLTKIKILQAWEKNTLAMAVCRNLTGTKPLHIKAWEEYLRIAEDVGSEEDKLTAAKALLDIDGSNTKYMRLAAKSSLELCLFKESRMWAEEIVLDQPGSPAGWLMLSEAWRGLGRNDLANVFADRTLYINPRYASALSHKALLMAETNKEKEALEYLRNAFAVNPSLATRKAIQNPCLLPLLNRIRKK